MQPCDPYLIPPFHNKYQRGFKTEYKAFLVHGGCHGLGSLTLMESEHNTITRKELGENKNTRNDITRRLGVQGCRRLVLNQNGSTLTRRNLI